MRSQKNEDIIKNMRKGRTTYCFLYQALVGIFVLGYVQSLKAEELPSQEVKAQSCEPIKSDETLSSARVRAIDAASFKAVSGLESLKSYKEELDSHDFNVMVYGIVDNYLEDVVAQTTEQSAEQICVEAKGYVSGQNLIQGINESFERQTKQEELTDETADKAADLSQAVTQVLDQATEKFEEHQKEALADKEIVYAEPSAEQVPQAEIKETVAPKEEQAPLSQEKLTPKEGLIYVDSFKDESERQDGTLGGISTLWGYEEFGSKVNFLLRFGDASVSTNMLQLVVNDNKYIINYKFKEKKWYHVAMTYDGTEIKFYIDYRERFSTNYSGNISLAGNSFNLGQSFNQWRGFNGKMSEVRIWNVARTMKELKDNALDVISLDEEKSKLLAYWKMNKAMVGSDNKMIEDISGNNCHITVKRQGASDSSVEPVVVIDNDIDINI